MFQFLLLLVASFAYATGGLFMKYSEGLTKPLPTCTFLLLFIAGALLQGRAMNTADLGMAYILVLGLEAGITVIFSAIVLGEHFSIARIVALTMVIAGSALLTQT
jgi:multidrug transporter EmrE-like cation transporter